VTTFSIPRPSKFYPNWYFWFENKTSVNLVKLSGTSGVLKKLASEEIVHETTYFILTDFMTFTRT
jgi:hypothetical protein